MGMGSIGMRLGTGTAEWLCPLPPKALAERRETWADHPMRCSRGGWTAVQMGTSKACYSDLGQPRFEVFMKTTF